MVVTVIESIYQLNSLFEINIAIHAQICEIEILRQFCNHIKYLFGLTEYQHLSSRVLLLPLF